MRYYRVLHSQAVRVNRRIASLGADIIHPIASLLDFFNEVHSLAKPQPGRPIQVRIFFDAGENDQYFLANDVNFGFRKELCMFLTGLFIRLSKILKEEKTNYNGLRSLCFFQHR